MEQHDLEKTLAVLLKKREQARELGVSSVPELDIQILNLEKEILLKTWQKKYDDLLADTQDAIRLFDAEKAKNKKLVSKLQESGDPSDFRAEREAWKRRIEDDAQTIKQLKAINMRLRETKLGGNKDVLELEREKQLLLLKIQELKEKGPEKLQELKE